MHKNIMHYGSFTALGFFSECFSSFSSFIFNLWWFSCSSFMATDLVLSSLHVPMLDARFLSLLYSAGEYKSQELKDLSGLSATVVNALNKIIGDGEYKGSLLSWFRDWLKVVASILWRLRGNGLIVLSSSQEKPSPSQWGETRDELYLIGCKTGDKAIIKFITVSCVKLVYPALRCGCVGVRESTGVCFEPPSPIPIAAGCSLCQLPPGLSSPTLSTSSSSTGAFSLCEGGKSCATNGASEGKIWKGQFY